MDFSQRSGIKPVKSAIQINEIDERLKNGLWNCISLVYFFEISKVPNNHIPYFEPLHSLFIKLYTDYFVRPIEEFDPYWPKSLKFIKDYYNQAKWNEVYDFIEFIANNYPNASMNQTFMKDCNKIFTRELSGYRFVNSLISPIADSSEVASIELATAHPLQPVRDHIRQSLELFSNRNNPDFRNSIKESISAVESIAKLIAGDEKATLGQALTKLGEKYKIHSAFKSSFEKMYGYTSDTNGIRHALLDESELNSDDARYFLIVCSAFVNYIQAKFLVKS
ncbi:AbiJ-NTD4 domain-containing protein [Leptospira saintgironsiae]|uniref:HEPN AbiJ-N-terminal domain-containing protein n=1 Tax=Leptospira saintgironsiae TaxID=2023183 RepID=A0A2M9Y7T1_9LEPT|nr:hypothetical protein [Leptospira saintgironsiae]PJZ47486.1 hypothetical protein CH362_18950 [Leptospira saintgironsiae]